MGPAHSVKVAEGGVFGYYAKSAKFLLSLATDKLRGFRFTGVKRQKRPALDEKSEAGLAGVRN